MSELSTVTKRNGFQWRSFDAYLFDIDGTLLNSRDWVHYNAFHAALERVYHCNGRIDNVPLHGNTDIGILRATARMCNIEGARFESPLQEALTLMGNEVELHAADLRPELCPSVRELLASLYNDGKLLGVCTGNLERIGWSKLKAAGVRRMFRVGGFSDRHEFRVDIFRDAMQQTESLLGSSSKICFVGDTPSDIQAAQQLNIPVLAVATGIYTLETLEQHRPTACVTCCTELL